MSTFSFFGPREPSQFDADLARVLVSLTFDPSSWEYAYPYDFTNNLDGMLVWVANDYYGLRFEVDGRYHGGLTLGTTFFGWLTPWRRKLIHRAKEASKSPYMRKFRYENSPPGRIVWYDPKDYEKGTPNVNF